MLAKSQTSSHESVYFDLGTIGLILYLQLGVYGICILLPILRRNACMCLVLCAFDVALVRRDLFAFVWPPPPPPNSTAKLIYKQRSLQDVFQSIGTVTIIMRACSLCLGADHFVVECVCVLLLVPRMSF